MVQRSLSFMLLAGIFSCTGDPTGDLVDGVDHLTASPTQLFVSEGATATVEVTAVDGVGNPVEASFEVTSVGAGITAVRDPNFEPIRDSNGDLVVNPHPTRIQIKVTATATTASSSFTVRAGGQDLVVAARVVPTTLAVAVPSNASPALGEVVTFTVPADFHFNENSEATPDSGGALVTTAVSVDGQTLSVIAGPSLAGPVSFSHVALDYSPATEVAVKSSIRVTSPDVTVVPGTLSSVTPAIQDTVTLTAGAGYGFLPSATITTGGLAAHVVSVGADSNTIKFIPVPGTGAQPPVVTGAILDFLPTVPLSLPVSASLTAPAGYAGAGVIATAPTIVIPAAGDTSFYVDAGATAAAAACGNVGNHCRFYKFVLATARTFTVTISWGSTADFGGYFINAAGVDQIGDFACDGHGSGDAAHPETCETDLGPGTYYLALADFTAGAQNTNYEIQIEGQ